MADTYAIGLDACSSGGLFAINRHNCLRSGIHLCGRRGVHADSLHFRITNSPLRMAPCVHHTVPSFGYRFNVSHLLKITMNNPKLEIDQVPTKLALSRQICDLFASKMQTLIRLVVSICVQPRADIMIPKPSCRKTLHFHHNNNKT